MKKRYFVRSVKGTSGTEVVDRTLRLAIATCIFRESARLIAEALNSHDEVTALGTFVRGNPRLRAVPATRSRAKAEKPTPSDAPEASE